MAKILLGGLGPGDVRNALGGVVFSKNTYGNYVRNNITPVNPQTPAQTDVRNAFANISQEWRALTPAQRDNWNTIAATSYPQTDVFGNQYFLTGFNLFMKLNMSADAIGIPVITNAPIEETIEQITFASITASVDAMGDGTVSFSAGFPGPVNTVPSGRALIIQCSQVVSQGKEFAKTLFKQITVAAPGQSVAAFDITAAWENVYGDLGTPDVDGKVFVRAVLVSQTNGQRGAEVTNETVVVQV